MIRQVAGFENYWVTETGRVYSVKRPKGGGMFLSLKARDKDGYPKVSIMNGRHDKKPEKVHKLVAEAFLGKRPDGYVVNHKDGDKTNNHVSNLEYVTYKQNTQHAWDNGLCTAYDRTKPYNRQGIIDANKSRTGMKFAESKGERNG